VPEGGEGFDRQRFSAGVGIDLCLGQAGDDGGGRKPRGAEIVGESLSLLRKDLADKGSKSSFVES